jgi:MscS family membrane protein
MDFQVYLELWWIRICVALLVAVIAYGISSVVFDRLKGQASKTKNLFDDAVIGAMQVPVNYGILLYAAWYVVDLIEKQFSITLFAEEKSMFIVANAILFAWFVLRLIKIREHQILKGELETKSDRTTIGMIFKILRVVVLVLTLMVVFQTLGLSISGIVAFGGVGGAAVAFASKDLLANFFGALMIFLDKPFAIGDWVRSSEKNIEGTVEHIGWRITRIRTFDKRPLYVPNSVFAQISIENPSRMTHRRIYETIGVRYKDFSQVHAICKDIEGMLKDHQDIDEGQTLMVNFNKFADSSLEVFVYCFTHTTHWQTFHQIKQRVLLEVGEIIVRNNAEMAFPSHSVYIENNAPADANVV